MVDTTGTGRLDLVVTNKLTGQVSVRLSLGARAFAPPAPYRAGTGLSAIDPGGTPEVTSLEATAGVAAGAFTTGDRTSLVTINPGSNTLDVLAGVGGGRFANPVALKTASPAQVVRVADFTGNGVGDLAVLTTIGVGIYLGNGKGGFLPPTTYAVPPEADGLTVADINHDTHLDLLVGDAYGDVLVLLGQGGGASWTQATSGSVQQVAQLLSFSGTTLDLAATLLTVSVVPGNNESESIGEAVATGGAIGFGQSVGQAKGNSGPTDRGEVPSAEPGLGPAGPAVVNDRLPTWERLSISLERAWDRARAAILELEVQGPAALDQKPSARGAVKARAERPVPAPAQRGTKAGNERTGRARALLGLAAATAAAGATSRPVVRWTRRRRSSRVAHGRRMARCQRHYALPHNGIANAGWQPLAECDPAFALSDRFETRPR